MGLFVASGGVLDPAFDPSEQLPSRRLGDAPTDDRIERFVDEADVRRVRSLQEEPERPFAVRSLGQEFAEESWEGPRTAGRPADCAPAKVVGQEASRRERRSHGPRNR